MKLAVAILVALVLSAGSVSAQTPEFRLGFQALASGIPSIAGEPKENEHYNSNGDSLQLTTMGLMAWRKRDNRTLFTNGTRTWIAGPNGVMDRGNDERFDWEGMPGIGERFVHVGMAVTVNSIKRVAQSDDKFTRALAGNTYLLVDVTVENVGLSKLLASFSYFELKGSDSRKYPNSFFSGLNSISDTIKQGEKARGGVAFQMPENATGLVLAYDTTMGWDTSKEMKFTLD